MKFAVVSVLLLSVWLCHATDTQQKALNPTPQQEGGADAADASLPPLQQNTNTQKDTSSAKDTIISSSKPEDKTNKDGKDKATDREEKDEGDDNKDQTEKKPNYWFTHSPCPMLNSLAASRGMPVKDLTPDILSQAFQKHLGADATFATKFATAAHGKFLKLVQKSHGPDATTVALRQLTASVEEGGIEHLASLSRSDTDYSIKPHEKAFRHTPRPDAARVDHELSLVKKKGQELISMDDVKTIRKWVQEQTPNLPLKHKLIGSVEICLLRGVLSGGDPVHRDMRADWYRSFLVDEKFPADYKVPTTKWGFGFVIKCVLSLSAREAASDIKAFFTNHLQHIPYLNGFTLTDMIALRLT